MECIPVTYLTAHTHDVSARGQIRDGAGTEARRGCGRFGGEVAGGMETRVPVERKVIET
jgi:hypothetical protein